jgi:hypothetical protein
MLDIICLSVSIIMILAFKPTMLSAVMPNDVMLSVVMPNVVLLRVVILNVVAPYQIHFKFDAIFILG